MGLCFVSSSGIWEKTLEIYFKDRELLRQGTRKGWTRRRTARSDEDLTAHSNNSSLNSAK